MKKPGDFRVVNHSVPRVDGMAKVTGQAVYSGDVFLPRMVYAKILRSPYAHARIQSIDVSEACRRDGVIGVLTADDLEGLAPYYGHAVKDHPLLAIGKVRFAGEPVAAVMALSEGIAHEALDDVLVEYEELTPVMDVQDALDPNSLKIHEEAYAAGKFRGFEGKHSAEANNICQEVHLEWGDVESAFSEAKFVEDQEFSYPMAYAYAMEPYTCVADVNQNEVTVYTCAQHPFIVRHDLASVFGVSLNQVRVIVPYVGGGYGSKSYTKIEPLTAACSRHVKRPVKLQLSVNEAMLTTRCDSAQVHVRTAADENGNLVARQAEIYMNTGAYAENSPLVCSKMAIRVVGPYRIPNVKVSCCAVYTNSAPASSFRGFGATQVSFAAESQMDELAEQAGLDPVEFRLKNLARPGESTHPKRSSGPVQQEALRGLDADLISDLSLLSEALHMSDPVPENRGRAVGCSASDAGSKPVSSAIVQVYTDDSVSVHSGTTELGQGGHTVMAQIAAEEMGVDFAKVRVVASDTGIVPFDRSTGASRSTTLMGRVVVEACRDAIGQMLEMAAELWDTSVDELTEEVGGVRYGEETLSWGQVLEKYSTMSGFSIVGRGYLYQQGDLAQLPPFWEIGCSGVEISVDQQTGRITVERLATVGDVGLAINPAMAEGQDLGAATMGLGLGLYEEMIYEGQELVNGSLMDYRVPRFSDLPKDIQLILAQNQDGVGPYGAKGGGEGALNPIPASLANALYRATGVRVREVPLTPERVWKALQEAKNKQS